MSFSRVVYLSGGVGGARLVHGLARVLPGSALTVVVNTGDDFQHWGLSVSPDLDTVMYTLADLGHVARGWGLAEESFHAFEMARRYGAPDWFQLGDRDLATHVMRTAWLREGLSLSEVTGRLCRGLDVDCRILPMCEHPRPTLIHTRQEGTLPFQDWLVRRRGLPTPARIGFDGDPSPCPGVVEALSTAQLVIIGPSNPYVSIDPILSLTGVRDSLQRPRVVAVSPIVGGRAVKGPLAEMIQQLDDRQPGPAAIADHYGPVLDGLVVQHGDEVDLGVVAVRGAQTLMRTRDDSEALARVTLAFASELAA